MGVGTTINVGPKRCGRSHYNQCETKEMWAQALQAMWDQRDVGVGTTINVGPKTALTTYLYRSFLPSPGQGTILLEGGDFRECGIRLWKVLGKWD